MTLTISDLIQIAIVTFFTTFFGRWTNRIIDKIEKKVKALKEKLKP
jgi:hypothetical protein